MGFCRGFDSRAGNQQQRQTRSGVSWPTVSDASVVTCFHLGGCEDVGDEGGIEKDFGH